MGTTTDWYAFKRALDAIAPALIEAERRDRQRFSAEIMAQYRERQKASVDRYNDPESREVIRAFTDHLRCFRAEIEHLKTERTGRREFWFREVSRFDIKPETEAAVLRALKHACSDLGIAVEIRWVRPELAELGRRDQYKKIWPPVYKSDSDFTGQAWLLSDFMLLKHNLTPVEAAKTVLHECRHLADARYGAQPRTPAERETWERRALEYERAAFAALRV